jgi:hypothetical protein
MASLGRCPAMLNHYVGNQRDIIGQGEHIAIDNGKFCIKKDNRLTNMMLAGLKPG